MRKVQFVNREIYHVYNRGVEKRDIFLNNLDHLRFIHDLFEFNDIKLAVPSNVKFSLRQPSQFTEQCLEVRPLNIVPKEKRPRELLVEILAWCLMPNHYHFLLRQLRDDGIVRFMQKLGTGYVMYFNQKYERSGVLFQGKFKAVLVENESYFMHLPFYIHSNPLDLIEPDWREGELNNPQEAIKFLENYRWSSHPDFLGKKNFPSVSQREFLAGVLGGNENYKTQFQNWVKEMKTRKEHLEELSDIILD